MNTRKIIDKAVKENPELALVLEISTRAREIELMEPARELKAAADVAANPTKSQGIICSGHVLGHEGNLIS